MKNTALVLLLLGFALSRVACGQNVPPPAPASQAAKSSVSIPDTPEALWSEIDAQRKALGDAVAAGNKADVSRLGDVLKALTKALPSKYPDAVAAKKKSIHHEAKMIGRLCDDLNDPVEQGKLDDAKAILGRIDELVKFVKESAAKK